jgi:hypothetical protein
MSWESAWSEGRTGWDAGEAVPALSEVLERMERAPGRALVPGAGSGYDALALAQAGWEVVALDVAPTAARRFEALRDARGVSAERARVEVGDFFTWEPGERFDLIWDYTFLCAIDPARRREWAARMWELLAPGGELVTLIFPIVDQADGADHREGEHGPPYRMHPELVGRLVAGRFDEVASWEPAASHPGREGMERVARWSRREVAGG